MPNPWLAALPPVLCNAVIVGGVIAFAMTGLGPGFWAAYAINALSVGLGELIASYVLGSVLLSYLPRLSYFRAMIPPERLKLITT